MKTIKQLAVGIMISMMLTMPILAINQPQTGSVIVGIGGNQFNGSAATNYAIITRHSVVPYAAPLVTYLNATSDAVYSSATTKGAIQMWRSTNSTAVFYPAVGAGFTNTTSNYFVLATNGIAAGTNLVIEHILPNSGPSYEYAQVFGVGTIVATNVVGPPSSPTTNFVYALTNTTALLTPIGPSDNVFVMYPGPAIPIGYASGAAANLQIVGNGITGGQRDTPLLITVIGATNGSLNAVCASFVP